MADCCITVSMDREYATMLVPTRIQIKRVSVIFKYILASLCRVYAMYLNNSVLMVPKSYNLETEKTWKTLVDSFLTALSAASRQGSILANCC